MTTYKRPKRKLSGKRYRAFVKVSDATIQTYVINDLLSFVRFLDKNRPGWRWFNVYQYVSRLQGGRGVLLASYTQKKRPLSKHPDTGDIAF